MAHLRAKLAGLIALALLAAIAVWHLLQPAAGIVPSAANGPDMPPTITGTPPAANAEQQQADQVQIVRPEAAPSDPHPYDPWIVRGRILYSDYHGVQLEGIVPRHEHLVRVEWLDFVRAESKLEVQHDYCDSTGHFEFEILRHQVDPSSCGWFVCDPWSPAKETPLRAISQSTPRPAMTEVPGLLRPRVLGRVIDLGDIRVDPAASGMPPLLITGRLVHTTGLTPTMPEEFALIARLDERDLLLGGHQHVNAEGRFALLKQQVPHVERCVWWLRHALYRNGLRLPAPPINGSHIDFGDIPIGGALVDVKLEAPGMPEAAVEHDLRSLGTIQSVEGVFLTLEAAGERHIVKLSLKPGPKRFAVPEGRYRYRASMRHQTYFARDVEGTISLPEGVCTPITIGFEPDAPVPVRILDPQGQPVVANVHWQQELPGGGIQDTGKGGPHGVPVREGRLTKVQATSDLYETVTGEVRPGDRELVLRFVNLIKSARLEVVLPKVPRGVRDKALSVSIEMDFADSKINPLKFYDWIVSDHRKVHTPAGTQPPGPARIWLGGGWTGGYPEGRLTEPMSIEIPESGTLRVELPEIAPPPWGRMVPSIVAKVQCGGMPAWVSGIFGFDNGQKGGRAYADGEPVYMTNMYISGYQVFETPLSVPKLLLAGSEEIPLRLDIPEGGNAILHLEVPPRLKVSVSAHGKEILKFWAVVSSRDSHGNSSCNAESGLANLWCPGGRATLNVSVEGREPGWHGEVDVPTEGCKDIQVKLDTFRVDFVRPRHSVSEQCPYWRVHAIVDGIAAESSVWVQWGKQIYLAPGKYIVRPEREDANTRAFEIDISADLEVTLPEVANMDTGTMLLRLGPAEWHDFEELNFWYYPEVDKAGDTVRLDNSGDPVVVYRSVEARPVPEGIRIRGLPEDRRILLHGYAKWREGEQTEERLLAPINLVPREANEASARWTRTVKLGGNWWGITTREVSELPGRLISFGYGMSVAPGNHELAFFVNGKESFRHTVTVPDQREPFDVPADLLRKLEEARERAKPPDE